MKLIYRMLGSDPAYLKAAQVMGVAIPMCTGINGICRDFDEVAAEIREEVKKAEQRAEIELRYVKWSPNHMLCSNCGHRIRAARMEKHKQRCRGS